MIVPDITRFVKLSTDYVELIKPICPCEPDCVVNLKVEFDIDEFVD